MPVHRKTIEELFWSKVIKTDGCWKWTGSVETFGYGRIVPYLRAPAIRAHRASWTIHNGPIPAGMWVLHRCDNPPCTNPDHLFLGTHNDNMADAWTKGRLILPDQTKKLARTHCPHGHSFDDKNTYTYDGRGRYCRECRRLAERRRRERIKLEGISCQC